MNNKITVSEMLAEISSELNKAHKSAAEQGIATMQFEGCEIELAVKADKDISGHLKVWLLDIGAGAKKTESNTIKLKFSRINSNLIQAPAKIDGPIHKIKRQN
jgi:hypothetical protein